MEISKNDFIDGKLRVRIIISYFDVDGKDYVKKYEEEKLVTLVWDDKINNYLIPGYIIKSPEQHIYNKKYNFYTANGAKYVFSILEKQKKYDTILNMNLKDMKKYANQMRFVGKDYENKEDLVDDLWKFLKSTTEITSHTKKTQDLALFLNDLNKIKNA